MAPERGTWRPRAVARLGNFTKLAAATSPSFCVAVVRPGWQPNACASARPGNVVVFRMDRRAGRLRKELSDISALSVSVRIDSSALRLNSLVCVLMPRFVAAF